MKYRILTFVITLALAAALQDSCSEVFDALEPVDVVLDAKSADLPAGTVLTVWGSTTSVTSERGDGRAEYAVTDSAVVDRYLVHRALKPRDGGLKWLPKSDAANFYAITPAASLSDETRGLFSGLAVEGRQQASGSAGTYVSTCSVSERSGRVRLIMEPAFNLVEVHLDTAALRQGRIMESIALTSTMSPLWGTFDVLAGEGSYRLPARTADNARLVMDPSGAEADKHGYLVLPFMLLPQRYSQLSLEILLKESDGEQYRYVVPLASPGEGDDIASGARVSYNASLPWIGGVTHPEFDDETSVEPMAGSDDFPDMPVR